MELHLSQEPLELTIVQKVPFEFRNIDDKSRDIDDLIDEKLSKLSYNDKVKVRNTHINGLAEYDKIYSCISIKKIWDTLELCDKI